MFDYLSVVSDSLLTMTFRKDPYGSDTSEHDSQFTALLNGQEVGHVWTKADSVDASTDEIGEQFKLWLTRPERKVGELVELEGKRIDELVDLFEELFVGAYILVNGTKVTEGTPAYGRALDWLRSTDFYTAPASSRYHDAVPGGLLAHSLRVYNKMVGLLNVPDFASVNVGEATFATLTHDWCKISYYESYTKNVKDNATGKWHEEVAYRVNQKGVPLGHGVTSMFLASRISKLSTDLALAIRWHMGEYNAASNELNELHEANAKIPLVYLIQFADRLACTEYVVH